MNKAPTAMQEDNDGIRSNGPFADDRLIVMLQGMGINERGWAKLLSAYGRVVLIQQGFLVSIEEWKHGERVFQGPSMIRAKMRRLDDALLGALTATVTLLMTLKYTRGQTIDLVIASSHNTGSVALLLKFFGKVRRVVSFIIDYLPPRGSALVRFHRSLTTWIMQLVARFADEIWLLSPRIPTGNVNPKRFVVPICISDGLASTGVRDEVAYIGFPSADHALEILFQVCAKHRIRANIIGDSAYLQSIKHLAPPDTVFHGLMNDPEQIGKILSRCFCGYAIYRDLSPNSYSYYGFPSKTLYCFASNVPVLITNVAHFNHNFERFGVGRVVEPNPETIEQAILDLRDNYNSYSKAIDRFRHEWNVGVEEFHRQRLLELWSDLPEQSNRA